MNIKDIMEESTVYYFAGQEAIMDNGVTRQSSAVANSGTRGDSANTLEE